MTLYKNSRIGYYGKNNVYKVNLLLQFFIFLLFLLWLHLCQKDQEPSEHLRWSSFRDQKEMFWKILDEPIICVICLLLHIYIFIYLFIYILVFIAIDKNHKYLQLLPKCNQLHHYVIIKGATKFYFMRHPRVVIILFKRVYTSQYFISVLLENYCLVFLWFLYFLSTVRFEFDVIFINLITYV